MFFMKRQRKKVFKNKHKDKSYTVQSFNISIQGANHIKKNKICQDYSVSFDQPKCVNLRKKTEGKYHIVVVCDGHGGNNYFRSDRGSKFGCECALESCKDFWGNFNKFKDKNTSDKDRDMMIEQLEKSIITKWNKQIQDDLRDNPISEDELNNISDKAREAYLSNRKLESIYGTTMLIAFYSESFWFGIQMGDGKCVVLNDDNTFSQPIPKNEKCFLNTTTSMCDFDAFDNFKYYYSDYLPKAIFLGTDGIDDSFANDEGLHDFYKVVVESFQATDDFEHAVSELKEYLPTLSAKGSGDDMSIAGIINLSKLKSSNANS